MQKYFQLSSKNIQNFHDLKRGSIFQAHCMIHFDCSHVLLRSQNPEIMRIGLSYFTRDPREVQIVFASILKQPCNCLGRIKSGKR